MFKRKKSKKRSRAMLSAYSIIMILIILLGILSHVLPKAKYTALVEEETVAVESEADKDSVNPVTERPVIGEAEEDTVEVTEAVAVEAETVSIVVAACSSRPVVAVATTINY